MVGCCFRHVPPFDYSLRNRRGWFLLIFILTDSLRDFPFDYEDQEEPSPSVSKTIIKGWNMSKTAAHHDN
jgi:hypothetical protein